MDSHRRSLHVQLAQHYGRKCRLVFPHGDWRQHEAHIASGWSYMARDLPWDQARDAVHAGWDMVDFDDRAQLFSAIGDEDEEGDAGDGDGPYPLPSRRTQ